MSSQIQKFVEQWTPQMEIVIAHIQFNYLTAALILLLTAIYLCCRSSKHVYLLDFVCFRAPEIHRVPISAFLEHSEILNNFDEELTEFQRKVVERSGIGNLTYSAPGMDMLPADSSLSATLLEVQTVFFSVVQTLLEKHRISPKSIAILITNCSLICPTPSIAAMIINKFGLRSDVRCFNLSGMGCSAGILSISLAKDLLKVHRNSLALVLSTEAICSNIYRGKVKSMLLANYLFRMGGTAILLSNKKRDRGWAKYELVHIVRTHLGHKNGAYGCVMQDEDEEGYIGVSLSRSILQVAGEALKTNMASLGSRVLPYSEQIRYALSAARIKFFPPAGKNGPYIPNFRKAFQHFCIHAGGKAVIDTIKERLKLTDRDVEASRMTLYR